MEKKNENEKKDARAGGLPCRMVSSRELSIRRVSRLRWCTAGRFSTENCFEEVITYSSSAPNQGTDAGVRNGQVMVSLLAVLYLPATVAIAESGSHFCSLPSVCNQIHNWVHSAHIR